MYYHVIIETSELERNKKAAKNKEYFQFDNAETGSIIKDVIIPHLQRKPFQFDGYFLDPMGIRRIAIRQTEKTAYEIAEIAQNALPPGVLAIYTRADVIKNDRYSTDITKEIYQTAQAEIDVPPASASVTCPTLDQSKVFIVHGQDDAAKLSVARFVEQLGFKPIILHEQASSGKTIIAKIESYTDVGFGIVLYTPCDLGKKAHDPELRARARQNVVFEHGYLIGKLGGERVCPLVKGDIETPNDISGIVYVQLDDHGAWKIQLAKEMRSAGYQIDMNKVI